MLFTDQLGRSSQISNPQRIVSLVPSITELLFDLGVKDNLIGRTKFCIHPSDVIDSITIIGGTKNVDIDKVISLNPDLVIANKEENVKEQIELLQTKVPVWVSNVRNFSTSMDLIAQLGEILDRNDEAESLVARSLKTIESAAHSKMRRAVYLIWKNPYMTIGGDTYIHDMMRHFGYNNLFGVSKRYPVITIDDIQQLNPDVVLLSSEPFPFREKHILELQSQLPESEVQLVDGELYSWYGTRLLHKKI